MAYTGHHGELKQWVLIFLIASNLPCSECFLMGIDAKHRGLFSGPSTCLSPRPSYFQSSSLSPSKPLTNQPTYSSLPRGLTSHHLFLHRNEMIKCTIQSSARRGLSLHHIVQGWPWAEPGLRIFPLSSAGTGPLVKSIYKLREKLCGNRWRWCGGSVFKQLTETCLSPILNFHQKPECWWPVKPRDLVGDEGQLQVT